MTTSKINKQFGEAVSAVLKERGLSYRGAMILTSISYNTIGTMRAGVVPGRDIVIAWAQGIGEPVNKWLELAGYRPLRPDMISEPGESYTTAGVHAFFKKQRELGTLSEKSARHIEQILTELEEAHRKGISYK